MVSVRVSHHRQHGSGELVGPARDAGGFPAAPGESDGLAGASYPFDKCRDGQPARIGRTVSAVALSRVVLSAVVPARVHRGHRSRPLVKMSSNT